MKRILMLSLPFIAALALGSAAAQAFMLQGPGGNSNGSSGLNLSDPDEQAPIQKLTPQSGSNGKSGDSNFHFGFSVDGNPVGSGSAGFGASPALGGSSNYFDPSRPPQMQQLFPRSNSFGFGPYNR